MSPSRLNFQYNTIINIHISCNKEYFEVPESRDIFEITQKQRIFFSDYKIAFLKSNKCVKIIIFQFIFMKTF